jgi:hypothetical protein
LATFNIITPPRVLPLRQTKWMQLSVSKHEVVRVLPWRSETPPFGHL